MEKFISSLAIRIALLRISNISKCNFLMIDEGWSNLDSDNMGQLSVLFDYLKDSFDFILVVSHLDSIKDFIDSTITVTFNHGYSKIYLE
jgi:DNA repair exonuclease SbcCD ATPase subunit